MLLHARFWEPLVRQRAAPRRRRIPESRENIISRTGRGLHVALSPGDTERATTVFEKRGAAPRVENFNLPPARRPADHSKPSRFRTYIIVHII